MKDRQTQRAVKNILHNELGITSEKVESLITEYIDKKFNDKVDRFMNSNQFDYMVSKEIQRQIEPIIRQTLKGQLTGININVSLKPQI